MFKLYLAANPFFDAFSQSDWMGKGIFFCLIALSIATWTLLIHKAMTTKKASRSSSTFYGQYAKGKQTPLTLELGAQEKNPLSSIYQVLKKQTLEVLNKNKQFGNASYLSAADLDYVEAHAANEIAEQTKKLEENLFLLSTIVPLAPFVGLLGTVWGILTTFSELQMQAGSSNQMMLGGLSLALTTTVLGLLIAIPALVGNNWLRATINTLRSDMESFSNEMIAAVELQYRQVDIR